MKRIVVGLSASAILFITGCDRIAASERAWLEALAAAERDAAPTERGPLAVEEALVGGDIGTVEAFEAPAQKVDAVYDEEFNTTNITLHATDDVGRVGMMILNFENTDLRTLEPGEYEFGALGGGFVANPLPGTVGVTGCSSDPACPDCNYDAPSSGGVIIIEEPPFELPDARPPPSDDE